MAFGKLQDLIPSSIKGLPQQNIINFTILGAALFIARLDHGLLNIDFVRGTAYSGKLATAYEKEKAGK